MVNEPKYKNYIYLCNINVNTIAESGHCCLILLYRTNLPYNLCSFCTGVEASSKMKKTKNKKLRDRCAGAD